MGDRETTPTAEAMAAMLVDVVRCGAPNASLCQSFTVALAAWRTVIRREAFEEAARTAGDVDVVTYRWAGGEYDDGAKTIGAIEYVLREMVAKEGTT
jgi:hypothetical protein